MKIEKEVDLSIEEVNAIQALNAKSVTIKNLIKDYQDDKKMFSSLLEELTKNQILYDTWFDDMGKKNKIFTTPENSWNVDFNNKKLQLLK